MQTSVFVVSFLLLPFLGSAQQSGGLDILKTYKIPTTSFMLGELNFSSNLSGNFSNREFPDSEFENSSSYDTYNFNLSPSGWYFSEDDNNRLDLYWQPQIYFYDYSQRNGAKDKLSPDGESYSGSFYWQKNLSNYLRTNYTYYLSEGSDLFLATSNAFNFYANHSLNKYDIDPNNGAKYRNNDSYRRQVGHIYTNSFLVGYGRVRNVTPVINALRFSDRLLQSGAIKSPLSTEEINKLSTIFSRTDDYSSVYDRSTKLYRDDVDQALSENEGFQKASEFQTNYAFESLSEMRYFRQEGWLVQGGLQSNYSVNDFIERYRSVNSKTVTTTFDETWLIELVLSGSLIQSLDLGYGYMVTGSFTGGPQTSSFSSLIQQYQTTLQTGVFYEDFDRLLLSASYTLQYIHRNYKNDFKDYGYYHYLSANGNYFIENNISINLNYSHSFNFYSYPNPFNLLERQVNGNYSLNLGLNWYFFRQVTAGLRPFELNP